LADEDLVRLRAQGESWSESDLLRLLKLASEAPWPMRDSPQPIVHLEAAVLQMATLEPGETLARLLARIEALDRRVGGEPSGGARGAGRSGRAGLRPGRSHRAELARYAARRERDQAHAGRVPRGERVPRARGGDAGPGDGRPAPHGGGGEGKPRPAGGRSAAGIRAISGVALRRARPRGAAAA